MSKKFKKTLILIIFLSLISFFGYENQEFVQDIIEIIETRDLDNIHIISQTQISMNLQETLTKDIQIEFCPSIGCFNLLNDAFLNANHEIKCAFYELDEYNLTKTLLEKSKTINISLVIDNKYLGEDNLQPLFDTSISIFSDEKRGTRYNNYMHDKFCIIDDKTIITGSTNPTINGFYKNNNNLLKINSVYLATNYENEFNTMTTNIFGSNKKSTLEYNNLTLNYQNKTYKISSYMCPQDNCDKIILNYLNKAEQEIQFATFALTHDEIANKLIEKSSTINITGLVESRNWNLKGSDLTKLNNSIKIYKDTNKNNMHHKFWIIDNKYIITGSMNPSASGAKYNDENILVIENFEVNQLFRDEFNNLISN